MEAVRLSTRRRLCRLVFCVACALPTLVVVVTIIGLRTPAYRAAQLRSWQRELSAALGMDTRLAGIRSCGAGRWAISGVECRDPESDEWLLRVGSADVARTSQGWVVSLGQPQVHARRVARLAGLLHEHVLRRTDARCASVQVAASTLELIDESYLESVSDVGSTLRGRPDGAELWVEFRATGAPKDQRVRMRFERNRQLDPPTTRWELQTGAAGLACSIALPWLPALGQLGDACVFQGAAWSQQSPDGWEAGLEGVFRQVDLEQLVTRQFPHRLSGAAVLTLSKCRVHRGRLTEAAGHLCCEAGQISQSLLDAAERSLALQQHARPGVGDPRPYRQLAVGFSLTAAGLVLSGPLPDASTLVADSHGPLLSLRDARPRSPLSLVHLLVPRMDLQVPATRETAALVRTLPLPESSTVPLTARRPER